MKCTGWINAVCYQCVGLCVFKKAGDCFSWLIVAIFIIPIVLWQPERCGSLPLISRAKKKSRDRNDNLLACVLQIIHLNIHHPALTPKASFYSLFLGLLPFYPWWKHSPLDKWNDINNKITIWRRKKNNLDRRGREDKSRSSERDRGKGLDT